MRSTPHDAPGGPAYVPLMNWMDRNLAMQGYSLDPHGARQLRIGLRFATALCLPIVATALVLESEALLTATAAIGFVAGFTPRHPFDLLWNHAVRHLLGAPAVPPNPRRRRHAFKVGTAWLMVVVALLAAGLTTAALVLGGMLLGACALVSTVNFCVPSFLLSVYEKRVRGVAAA